MSKIFPTILKLITGPFPLAALEMFLTFLLIKEFQENRMPSAWDYFLVIFGSIILFCIFIAALASTNGNTMSNSEEKIRASKVFITGNLKINLARHKKLAKVLGAEVADKLLNDVDWIVTNNPKDLLMQKLRDQKHLHKLKNEAEWVKIVKTEIKNKNFVRQFFIQLFYSDILKK